MPKRVIDVGNCDVDHMRIRGVIEDHFAAEVVYCHSARDALRELRAAPADLVLVNRLLDVDGSEGVELIRKIKADPQLAGIPCMLVSNHAEHQAAALAAGAEAGFGKRHLKEGVTRQRLARFLGDPTE
jgi:two-component system chemotaxis response regulator CheY